MFFTEGKDREFERMMREKPGIEHKREKIFFATAKNKDCPHCLYYSYKGRKCLYKKCIVFPE